MKCKKKENQRTRMFTGGNLSFELIFFHLIKYYVCICKMKKKDENHSKRLENTLLQAFPI